MKYVIALSLCALVGGFQLTSLPRTVSVRRHPIEKYRLVRASSCPLVDVDVSSSPDPVPEDWLDKLNHRLEGGLGSVLLLTATAVSVCLANSALAPNWLSFWNSPSSISITNHVLSFRDVVNEGFMALFFFLVGLEIKHEIVAGSLSSIRSAILPCIAACGGMVVPMLVYVMVNLFAGPSVGSMSGVVVPMATDIAFAMGVFSLFGGNRKFPAAVSAFLLTLATVDDIGAILVIATCFAKHVSLKYLGAAALAQAALVIMEKNRVTSGKAYILVGAALWYSLFCGGVNADIAGVLTGLCVHSSKSDGRFLHRLVRRWKPVSALAIMPLFALANTAIPVLESAVAATATATEALASEAVVGRATSVAAGIFAGLTLGKPLGIIGVSWLAVKLGIAEFPENMTKLHLGVVGLLGGIGFTMCIFLIEQALPAGRIAMLGKIGVIAASVLSAAAGAVVMTNAKNSNAPNKEIKMA